MRTRYSFSLERKKAIVLGIESSCDETAVAIVAEDKEILSNIVYSQVNEHLRFGGVVPEVAARAHLEKIDSVVNKALADANIDISNITAVAGTCGPGLIGGVIVGATFAKSISMAMKIPFLAVDHVEAHAISIRLTEDVSFPYLLMLVSGGHCQSCIVHSIDHFEIIGRTIDDSIGESFDKVARLLGLGYPGGAEVEKISSCGSDKRFPLPHPLCNKNSCDFSFSGLKTAVRAVFEKCKTGQDRADLCASFQKTTADILIYKVKQAIEVCHKRSVELSAVAVSGGVAANKLIRHSLLNVCNEYKLRFLAPPIHICTDNGAMVAWLGIEKLLRQQFNQLNFAPYSRYEPRIIF